VWIIEGSCSANRIIGECFAPGTDDHSSFRSKLAGIYTCLLFIYHCFQHTLQTKPTFYLACDGKSVLHRLWNPRMTLASEPHYDLLSGTRWLLSEGGFTFTLAHIKGHQDNGEIMVLTQDASLNIEADALAKAKLACYVPGLKTYVLPLAYGACYVGGRRMVKNVSSTLRNHINGLPAIKYWQQRCSITSAIWATIDWPLYQCAMSEIPLH